MDDSIHMPKKEVNNFPLTSKFAYKFQIFYSIFLILVADNYPFSTMNLVVNGQIESGQIPNCDGICVKYDITWGKDWQIHSGIETGISQHAYKSMQTNDRFVWNFPFEMVFQMNDVSGWPKVCL